MPIRMWVDGPARLIRGELWDDFDMDAVRAAVDAVLSDPAFESGFDVLTDHTRLTRFLTAEEARAVAGHLATHRERLAGARWAIVTANPASFGMMRVLGALLEDSGIQVRPFTDAAAAEAWLAAGGAGRE